MAITVITPASNKNLTTVSAVTQHLNISGSEAATNSDYLQALVNRASSFIENYCNRVFAEEEVDETLPSTGEPRLLLSRLPIVSVTSATYKGEVEDATNYYIEDADAGFLFNKKGWRSTTVYGRYIDYYPTSYAVDDWTIRYTGGYKLPGETDRNLPHDIELACILIVAQWYKEDKDTRSNIRKLKIGDAEETYSSMNNLTLRQDVYDILDRWVITT